MISRQTSKAASIAAGLALVGASLASVPAQAAPGDLSFEPTTGPLGSFNVFNADTFDLTLSVDSISVSSTSTLAYKIEVDTNDQYGLKIDFGTTSSGDSVRLDGYTAAGEKVAVPGFAADTDVILDNGDTTPAEVDNGKIYVDFEDNSNDITSIVVHTFKTTTAVERTPVFEIIDADGDASADGSGVTTASLTRAAHGDLDSSITVTAWLDLDSDTSDIESTYQAGPQVINFYDPDSVSVISSIGRLTATGLSDDDDSTAVSQEFLMDVAGQNASDVTGRMKFNKDINFAQTDLTKWTVGTSGTVTTVALRAIDYRESADDFAEAPGNFEVLTASNGLPAEANGELLFRVFTGQAMEAGKKVQVNFKYDDSDETSTFSSPQFTLVQNDVAETAVAVDVEVSPTAASSAIDGGSSTNLSSGVSAFTFTGTAQTTGGADVETANIPMVVRVQATDFLPAGEVLTVSGTGEKISRANQAVYVSGLTNSDGEFAVTVTAAEAATGTDYDIQFFIQNGANGNDGDLTADTKVTATYAAPNANAVNAVNAVSSASSPVLEFNVLDTFGEGVSMSATGDQYSIELAAPNTDDLELYAPVSEDGTVSFTFDNWLSAGESELLTAKLYKGTSTNPATTAFTGDQATVTLYAPVAANAVNLNRDEIVDMDIEFNDFITGKKTTTVGPTSGTNSETVNGSVTDANGAGIPGTPVTLSAEGVQFLTGTDYSIGTVELLTDAAGTFSAEIWVNTKSATGITLTATAGTLTDEALIKTDHASGTGTVDRGNLLFTVDMPDNVVVNTTYAVTATVTDVFDNPIDGATVKFDGFGSATFNGAASAERLTNKNGEAVAYLRSLKDIDGLSSVEVSVTKVDHDGDGDLDVSSIASAVAVDDETTSWDETAWSNVVEAELDFLSSASEIPSTQKVNAGSFKGYVAVYALGYEGQRLSAKIGNDWVIVDPIVNNESANLARVTDFTGAGVDIAVRIYIDRVLIDTINLTTK